jgi:aldehyde:ferredoxin oxidoreductase
MQEGCLGKEDSCHQLQKTLSRRKILLRDEMIEMLPFVSGILNSERERGRMELTEDFTGTIAYVDLAKKEVRKEVLDAKTYRKYFGGTGIIARELLRLMKPGVDPLGPDNVLVIAAGPLTGGPYAGSGRSAAGAKSPLTGGFGVGEGGGFFGPEMRRAGFDVLVITEVSPTPVYLYLHDGEIEIRDASAIWGKTTGEAQKLIQEELGDRLVRVCQCGPAGERMVRFAAIANDVTHYIGRSGIGAVMGSKKLRAIAARGTKPVPLHDPEKVREIGSWMNKNWKNFSWNLHDVGTAGGLKNKNVAGGLPTKNFTDGVFDGADAITGQLMRDTILVGRESCYACPIQCKRVVEVKEGPYTVDPQYGGPEYETAGALGSTCGVDDLRAVAKANEICNAYGLDTISAGVTIAFAMECYEKGLLTKEDTGGIDLRFGNGEAMLKMLMNIVNREGLGDLLANGCAYAAKKIGKGAEDLAMHVRGQEIPMHDGRQEWGLGLGYGVSITGADHQHNMHDIPYASEGRQADNARALGVTEVPLPARDLSPEKAMLLKVMTQFRHFFDCAVMCTFMPYTPQQMVDLVRAVTGWETGTAELMAIAERAHVLARVFNIREGMKAEDEKLPKRFFTPLPRGPLSDKTFTEEEWERAKLAFYRQSGWTDEGIPTEDTLARLGIRWAGEEIKK